MIARLASLGAVALVAACELGSSGAECVLSEDCEPGLSCFASTCRESEIPPGNISWRISPPAPSGLLPAAFPQREEAPRLSLCPPSTLAGALGFEGRTRLVAQGELASLPGQEEVHEFWVESSFEIGLPPGAWTLTFHPEAGLPPIRRRIQLARCEARQLSTIESQPTRTARFQVVIDAEQDPRLLCGAHVRIHDPRDGAPLSVRRDLPAPAGAGCDGSRNEILLPFRPPEDHGIIEVRIGALDARRPTIPQQRLRFALGDEEPLDLGLLGANPGGGSLQRVLVHVFDHEKAPQRQAHLVAEWLPPTGGALAGAPQFRSAPGAELSPGLYELWLLPGRYAFRAEPPPSSGAGVGSCVAPASEMAGACGNQIEVGPTLPAELAMALPRKLHLWGTVTGAGPAALEGATITAIPARGGEGRAASATVDRSGAFHLLLDAGDYDLRVEPADRLVPILHRPLPTPLLVDTHLELELPPALLVLGTVRRSEGLLLDPLPEAMVRAYRLVPGEEPLLLGEALTGWDGSFAMALPAGP